MNIHRGSDFNEFLIEQGLTNTDQPMTPTPRTDAAEIVQTFANQPDLRTSRVPIEFARQLERENQTFRNAQKACEDCDAPRVDRIAQLERELAETAKDYRCLAELLDGHDATECRANLSKLKDAVQTLNDCADYLNRRLAEERALADRLADDLEGVAGLAFFPLPALAAWKEARK